jgi:hypothetical protein
MVPVRGSRYRPIDYDDRADERWRVDQATAKKLKVMVWQEN